MTEMIVKDKIGDNSIKTGKYGEVRSKSLKESVGITIQEFFYFLFFGVMFGIRSIGFYEGQRIYNIAIVIGMLFWFCKIVVTKHTLQEYIFIIVFMMVAGLAYLNSGEKGLLFDFAMMLGMKGVSSRRVIKLATAILAPAMIVLTILSVSGLKYSNFWPAQRPYIGLVFRSSFGYPHPNTAQTTLFLLSVMILYLSLKTHENRLNVHVQILMTVFTIYYFLYTQSKTGLLMFFVLLFLYNIVWKKKRISKLEKSVLISFYPVSCFASLIVAFFGFRMITDEMRLKSILDRIYLAGYYLCQSSLSLFGQRIEIPGQELYGIDISSIYLLMNYGIVAFVIMLVIWPIVMREFLNHNDYAEIMIAILFFIMGLSDPFFYNLSFKNILFIFAGEKLFHLLETAGGRKQDMKAWSVINIGSGKVFRKTFQYCASLKSFGQKISVETLSKQITITEFVFVILFLISSFATIFRSDLIYTDVQIYPPVSVSSSVLLSEQEKGNIIIGNTRVNKNDDDSYMMCIIADRWSKNIPDGAYVTNIMVKLEALKLSLSISLGISLLLACTLIFVYYRKLHRIRIERDQSRQDLSSRSAEQIRIGESR